MAHWKGFVILYMWLCTGILCDASLLSVSFNKLKEHFQQNTLKRNVQRTLPSPWLYQSVQTKYIEQDVDQFDPENKKTFFQRYFVCEKYWNQPDGPVFLYIGGEGQLVPEVLMGGEIVSQAVKHGALLFAVEHRYYGQSVRYDSLKSENIHFLSSQQALADIADFYEFAVQSYNLTAKNRWIAYGGSYPGSLAAWLRTKFPHIVFGAVASSAPVLAKTNFEGYNEVVSASLASSLVGGSPSCSNAIGQAFATVDTLIQRKMFDKLREDFSSCNDISNGNDTYMFVQNLAGIFMGVVQYNNEEEGLTIRKLCQYMTDDKKTPYERLRGVNKAYLQEVGETCNTNSYKNYINLLKKDTMDPSGAAAMRQWFYQTCSQFGYYQTCDPSTSCVFSHLMKLRDYTDVCQEVFGIPEKQIERSVQFTNAYYGGKRPSGSRIVFVNGSIDPWHWLSVLRNTTMSDEVAIFIPGTAHCANMESASPRDPKPLTEARKKIEIIVEEWLKM